MAPARKKLGHHITAFAIFGAIAGAVGAVVFQVAYTLSTGPYLLSGWIFSIFFALAEVPVGIVLGALAGGLVSLCTFKLAKRFLVLGAVIAATVPIGGSGMLCLGLYGAQSEGLIIWAALSLIEGPAFVVFYLRRQAALHSSRDDRADP